MVEVLKSDIFFFVTTVAIVFVTVLVIVALVYVIKIIRDIRHISKRVKTEADYVMDDFGLVRSSIRKGGEKAAKKVGTLIKKATKGRNTKS